MSGRCGKRGLAAYVVRSAVAALLVTGCGASGHGAGNGAEAEGPPDLSGTDASGPELAPQPDASPLEATAQEGGGADGAPSDTGRTDAATTEVGGADATRTRDAGRAHGTPPDAADRWDTGSADTAGNDADAAGPDAAPGPDAACGEPRERLLDAILGRPTDRSVALSVQAAPGAAVAVEYGAGCGAYAAGRVEGVGGALGDPVVLALEGLAPDTRYEYRVLFRLPGEATERFGAAGSFQTARARGRTFSFGVQGDSHPERLGRMFSPNLYAQNLTNVAARRPDFYLLLGDDFSLERLLTNDTLTATNVDAVYRQQREWLAQVGSTSAIFLVNGNHEQAAGYLLTEAYATPFSAAPVLAGSARVRFFPLPAPDAFYSGDALEIAGVGLVRDYYAWQWGDALFVTIDPYWHSPVPVDTGVPGVEKVDDEWLITMGDEQYAWLARTLTESTARWKFVFTHHVLGHGRGGAAIAHQHEWGGYAKNGRTWEFDARRPTWAQPVHQLLVQTGVAICFFGHDHLYARERVDGLVYQSVPNPADDSYTAFNADAFDPDAIPFPGAAYDPDDGVVLPNSGYLHVTVSPDAVTVAYVRAVLPGTEAAAGAANGDVSCAYTLPAR